MPIVSATVAVALGVACMVTIAPKERDVMTTLRDAVELGVACFVGLAGAPDEAIETRLEALGVERWLARRLVTWLPVVFGRLLLPEVEFPADYHSGSERLRFADDPVFVAAQRRVSERATRSELEAIGLRSADVAAANAYLSKTTAEGRTPDLASVATATALVTPLPPLGEGDGGVPEPRDTFHALLRAHGQRVEACDARVFPRVEDGRFSLQVDFAVQDGRLSGGRLLESFGGFGATWRAAVGDALRKFEQGSVHVLIAGLFDEASCADQVTWETWPHPEGPRRVCLGPQLGLYGRGAPPLAPLVDRLRDALARVPLGTSIHALRIFTMRQGARSFSDEVLLDGEPWAEGQQLCAGFEWPTDVETLWGTRLFALVLPGS